MKQGNRINWSGLAVLLITLIAFSFGLAYLLQKLWGRTQLPLDEFAWLACLIVFGVTLLCNLTIIAPVPVAAVITIAAATRWNPILVSLSASIGGTLGELSGYYAGYLGKRIVIAESMVGYEKIASWMRRYGAWAIFFLAFQPILPFDICGLIAGASRMPMYRFLLPLWAGKFPKYIILCYSGIELAHFLPFWPK